ncbi:MAG: Gfo/Idh/MocA family protein [Phycisphaerales bacterium]
MLTRRTFNIAGLALGAGAALGFAPRSLHLREERSPLRVGVVGCGGRGTGAAVQALFADNDSVLWAVGDLYPERIQPCLDAVRSELVEYAADPESVVSKKISVDETRTYTGFGCIDGVLAAGVDVVLLTTPPCFRPDHLRRCVDAGVHVFCEKPVAVDGAGVRSVLESARRAREAGLSLMSGFCWRYQDQVVETMARIRSGGIGELRALQTTYNTTGWIKPKPRQPQWSDAEFMTRNWHYFHTISGDHIVEQAVHAIDWQAWAMGDRPPVRCWAIGGRQVRPDLPETGNVFDHFGVTYEYADGVRAYHMCRHWENTPSDNSALFIGSSGVCTMQPWQQVHRIDGIDPWTGSAQANDMYQREHDVLFRSIREGQPVNDGEFMAHSTLLAVMARTAAYTGRVVTWTEAMHDDPPVDPVPWSFGDRLIPKVARPGRKVVP